MTEKTVPRFRKVKKYHRKHVKTVGVKGYMTSDGTLVKRHRRRAHGTEVMGHLQHLPANQVGKERE